MMKRLIALLIVSMALAFVWACEENTAQEYGSGLVRSVDRAERAADTASLSAVRQSIEAYRSTNGKYPESLDEVATGLDTSRYDYDPATGNVSLR